MRKISIEQGSPEWKEMRRRHIGASDAPVIMGDSPYKTPYQLWLEKLGLYEQPTTAAMQRGTRLEEEARQAFISVMGIEVQPCVLVNDSMPWMMASLDGLSADECIGVEIKCPGEATHEAGKIKQEPPPQYWAQVQAQLMVGKRIKKMYYFSYMSADDFYYYEVERDRSYIESLHESTKDFWDKISSLEAPKLTDRDYQETHSDEWFKIASLLKGKKADIKSLEDECDALEKELICLSNGNPTKGFGFKFSKVVRKGNVDYKAVPELKGIDLEPYRKKPQEYWRLFDAG